MNKGTEMKELVHKSIKPKEALVVKWWLLVYCFEIIFASVSAKFIGVVKEGFLNVLVACLRW